MTKNQIFSFPERHFYYKLIFFIPMLFAMAALLFFFITHQKSYKNIVIYLFGFILFLGYLRAVLWLFFGKETIEITANQLSIKRTGSFFLKDKIFEIKEIQNLKFELKRFSFGVFIAQNGSEWVTTRANGPICFSYEKKAHNFGGKVDEKTAEEIINLIKDRQLNRPMV